MSAFGQGLSAAGYGAGEMYAKQGLADQLANAQLERDRRLEELRQASHDAPLNRMQGIYAAASKEEVPQEATPVTSMTGGLAVATTDGQAPDSSGFQGDPAAIRKQIMALPDSPDKSAALAQLNSQITGEQERNRQAVAGKTRKRTREEALSTASERAMATDMPAYAAFEKEIGKPLRDERRVDIQQDRENNRQDFVARSEDRKSAADARRADIDLRKLDLQQGNLDANNRKIDALIDHWERKDENDETKANKAKAPTADRMGSVINAMNATIKNLDENRPRASAGAEEKAEWQSQRSNAMAVRARATEKLNSNFDDAPAAPANPAALAPAPKPAASKAVNSLPAGAKQIGTSGGKPVYQTPDGKKFIAQ
jgi:hypothetical protein